MRLLLAALASTAILAGTAYAQTQEGGAAPLTKDRPTAAPNTTGVAPGAPQRPTAPAIGRPNEPRVYGETNQAPASTPTVRHPWHRAARAKPEIASRVSMTSGHFSGRAIFPEDMLSHIRHCDRRSRNQKETRCHRGC